MTENQRLKIVRKFLNKTQVDFAASIGLTQAGYSDIERGKNNVSGKIKILLKREHNVNLDWLESGNGEMFAPIDESQNPEDKKLIISLQSEIERLQIEIDKLAAENSQYREQSESMNQIIEKLKSQLNKK